VVRSKPRPRDLAPVLKRTRHDLMRAGLLHLKWKRNWASLWFTAGGDGVMGARAYGRDGCRNRHLEWAAYSSASALRGGNSLSPSGPSPKEVLKPRGAAAFNILAVGQQKLLLGILATRVRAFIVYKQCRAIQWYRPVLLLAMLLLGFLASGFRR